MTRITVLGIDPGLNFTGYSIVAGTLKDGEVSNIVVKKVGIIRPEWAAPSGSLEKVRAMMTSVEKQIDIRDLKADYCVIEFQQKYPKAKEFHYVNPNDLIKLGYISATAGVTLGLENVVFVLPRIWTRSKAKKKHQEITLSKVKKDITQWPWFAKENNQRAVGDAIDATGLAIWGLEEMARSAE